MPRLAEFYGIVIYMYWRDHAPPHFHAIYGGDEAQIRIEDARVMEGGLPATATRLVREWADTHRDELTANWERAQRPKPSIRSSRCNRLVSMSRPARIAEVEYLGDHRLRLSFSDGLVRELDFAGALTGGGVFDPLRDPVFFGKVAVDEVAGTIAWPNGVDLDPDVLHGDHEPATGAPPQVLREYRLRPTG